LPHLYSVVRAVMPRTPSGTSRKGPYRSLLYPADRLHQHFQSVMGTAQQLVQYVRYSHLHKLLFFFSLQGLYRKTWGVGGYGKGRRPQFVTQERNVTALPSISLMIPSVTKIGGRPQSRLKTLSAGTTPSRIQLSNLESVICFSLVGAPPPRGCCLIVYNTT
jgi:hypothetical protein